MESFGSWLKQRRRALGLTQGDLARRVGCAEVTVRKIEADERRPSPQVAGLIADQLSLAPGERARFLLAARAAGAVDELPDPTPSAEAPPLPPTPLIGRDDDLERLAAALRRPELRLLTISGPPGIGKTRLALQLAHHLRGEHGQISFVALAPIADPELVASAIAQSLGALPAPGEPVRRRLRAALQGRHLLILDNFEQVLPAAELLAELLAAAADLKIVVTSRAALRLLAEHEYPLSPLALPAEATTGGPAGDRATGGGLARDSGETAPPPPLPPSPERAERAIPSLAAVEAAPAVRLFVQRARAVRADFRLTQANGAAVAAICARLDGLPLAIELAAARVRTYTPPELLARLEGAQLGLLTDGPRDLPARQRTLRDAISWSYQLLSPAERRLLDWLGVFVGGWSLADLEAVAGEANGDLADPLGALIDHNLVRAAESAAGLRFWLLETVREFALERLAARGELAAARARHAARYLELALAAGSRRSTLEHGACVARLVREQDNLRAALAWAIAAGDDTLALELGEATAWFWRERGHLSEGLSWYARLIGLAPAAAPGPWRARTLRWAADLALHQGDYRTGVACAAESEALFRALGDQVGLAAALDERAYAAVQQGDLALGVALQREGLAIRRQQGDPVQLARSLAHLGWSLMRRGDLAGSRAMIDEAIGLLRGSEHELLLAELLWDRGDTERLAGQEAIARRAYDESLELLRRGSAGGDLADALHVRAFRAYREGDHAQAAQLFAEEAELARRHGQRNDVAWATNHRGDALRAAGNYDAAAACYEESLHIFRAEGHRQGEAAMLHNLAYVARRRGDLDGAAAQFRQALAIFRAVDYTWSVADAVIGLGAVAAARGDGLTAARLLGAAEAAQRAIDASGFLLEPANQVELARTLADLDAHLGEAERRAAWAAGAALALGAAADEALGLA